MNMLFHNSRWHVKTLLGHQDAGRKVGDAGVYDERKYRKSYIFVTKIRGMDHSLRNAVSISCENILLYAVNGVTTPPM